MSAHAKYLKILSAIIPAGAFGASLLLGSTALSAANNDPAGVQPSTSGQVRVSERLAAIREAVSAVADPGARPGEGNLQLAWGNRWNNWGRRGGWRGGGGWGVSVGWGRPWNNWRNGPARWNNWWRNW
jgi:rSAM-associated Gly-rich repeat protein